MQWTTLYAYISQINQFANNRQISNGQSHWQTDSFTRSTIGCRVFGVCRSFNTTLRYWRGSVPVSKCIRFAMNLYVACQAPSCRLALMAADSGARLTKWRVSKFQTAASASNPSPSRRVWNQRGNRSGIGRVGRSNAHRQVERLRAVVNSVRLKPRDFVKLTLVDRVTGEPWSVNFSNPLSFAMLAVTRVKLVDTTAFRPILRRVRWIRALELSHDGQRATKVTREYYLKSQRTIFPDATLSAGRSLS